MFIYKLCLKEKSSCKGSKIMEIIKNCLKMSWNILMYPNLKKKIFDCIKKALIKTC